jgi:hypothetical protein
VRRAGVGAAEHADEQGGDHCGRADREAARAGERFLMVGGRWAAKRSNMARVPFFLVRARARMTDLSAAGAAGDREVLAAGGRLPGRDRPWPLVRAHGRLMSRPGRESALRGG